MLTEHGTAVLARKTTFGGCRDMGITAGLAALCVAPYRYAAISARIRLSHSDLSVGSLVRDRLALTRLPVPLIIPQKWAIRQGLFSPSACTYVRVPAYFFLGGMQRTNPADFGEHPRRQDAGGVYGRAPQPRARLAASSPGTERIMDAV